MAVVGSVILYYGKSAAISSLLALFISHGLFVLFPFKESIKNFTTGGTQLLLSEGALLLLFFILTFIIVRKSVSVVFPWNSTVRLLETALFSVLIVSGVFILFGTVVDTSTVTAHLPIIKKVLAIPNALFWWMSGSLTLSFLTLNRA